MNWYEGNIAEAVAMSKTKNAIFVVYVEGKDDLTLNLTKIINEHKIKIRLESDDFVAIKISSDSQAYMQFAKIYQVVPVPSIFFIGSSGTPLDIGTGIIASSDELAKKIDYVLAQSGKSSASNSSLSTSASFIATEQAASVIDTEQAASVIVTEQGVSVIDTEQAASVIATEQGVSVIDTEQAASVIATEQAAPVISTEQVASVIATEQAASSIATEQAIKDALPTTSTPAREEVKSNAEIPAEENVCTNDVCQTSDKPEETATAAPPEEPVKPQETPNSGDINARLEETRKQLEQKRRERLEMEKQREYEQELRRRQDGIEIQELQALEKGQHLKELKENIRRERLEEQAARDRIRAQIAGDRAERAQRFAEVPVKPAEAAAAGPSTTQPSIASDSTRLQFRLPTGDSKTQTFNGGDTLSVVRAFVLSDILPGTGIRDFILATTYPKREFTAEHNAQTLVELGLFPSAVILIIAKEGRVSPAGIIVRSGGIVNMLTTLLWTLLTPVFVVFGYFTNRTGSRGGAESGASKRANEEQPTQQDANKRRNLERFMSGPSTSQQPAADSPKPSVETDSQSHRRYVSGSNIHRLSDNRKDSDDENATWNGNSTQQQ